VPVEGMRPVSSRQKDEGYEHGNGCPCGLISQEFCASIWRPSPRGARHYPDQLRAGA
jgi:hypothetical protein